MTALAIKSWGIAMPKSYFFQARLMWISTSLGALLQLLSATPSLAQEVLGKTIQAEYSIASCNAGCQKKFNFYVSPQRRLYWYTGKEQGDEYTLGVIKPWNIKGTSLTGSTTFVASGNTLEQRFVRNTQSFGHGVTLNGETVTMVITLRGNTCSIAVQSKPKATQVSASSCSVIDGNPN